MLLYFALLWLLDPRIIAFLITQVSIKPDPIESLWPVSVAGWFGLFVAGFLLGEKIINTARGGKKQIQEPIFEKIDECTHKLEEEISRLRTDVQRDIEVHRKEVDRDINGVGGRLTEIASETNRAVEMGHNLAERMIRSEVDRAALRKEIELLRDDIRQNHEQSRKETRIARKQILAAIAAAKQ